MSFEREKLTQNQFFAYKLRNLYLKDQQLFFQINNYIPFSVHINRIDNLNIIYANNQLLKKGPEMEELLEQGSSYLPKISCQVLLKNAVNRVNYFQKLNDQDKVCEYLQQLRVNKTMKYFYSNKLILNEKLYFNVSSFTDDMGLAGKAFESVFEPFRNDKYKWLKFQSLTKQERKIIRLFAQGKSENEISEVLYISTHTVHTHKKNIFRKLDVHKTSQLVRFAMALEIV